MRKKKLNNKQLQEKQKQEDKKFRKFMIIRFSILFLFLGVILVFVTYWCDTKYAVRRYTLYGKKISGNLICMNSNRLTYHDSEEFTLNDGIFYACGENCKKALTLRYEEMAYVADAYSGDTIRKCDAIIGLKEKGEPDLAYFMNAQNFQIYYEVEKANDNQVICK